MKLTIILIHGIGPTKEDWAEGIIKELKKKTISQIDKLLIDTKVADIDEILEVRSVYWKDVFEKREGELNDILNQQIETINTGASFIGLIAKFTHLGFYKLQNDIITNFIGDIIAYGNREAQYDTYNKISQTLDNIAQKSGILNSKAPLTIIAHSLGTVITSDFIYDHQKERQIKNEAGFDSRFCLYNLFTIGSPIALFSLRFGSPSVFNRPINVENMNGRWLNIYDTDDPVGMPLRPLNNAYAEAVFRDVKVDAGIYGLSHTKYFTDSKTLNMISCKLAIDWLSVNKKFSQEKLDTLYNKYDETLCIR